MVQNPWLVDPSEGATGNTYEIRTLVDFFTVPADRRSVCLREFHAWLSIQENITALLTCTDEVKREHLHWQNEVFRWIDDGKGAVSVVMQPLIKVAEEKSGQTKDSMSARPEAAAGSPSEEPER